jgi:hypothetical protein
VETIVALARYGQKVKSIIAIEQRSIVITKVLFGRLVEVNRLVEIHIAQFALDEFR